MKENTENIIESIKQRIRKSNKGLWAISIVLMIFSLVLMYSTTELLGNPLKNTFKQFVFFVIAYAIMIVAHFVHYNHIRKAARYAPILMLILLLWLMFFGATINGAKRWVIVPFIGTVQPSEFIKILLVLYVARTLAIFQTAKGCHVVAFRRIAVVAVIICLGIAVTDISTAGLMALTVFIMLVVGRVRVRILLKLLLVAAVAIGLTLFVSIGTNWRPDVGRVTTALNRIERFVAPERAAEREAVLFSQIKTKRQRDIALANKQRREGEYAQVEAAKAAIATGGLIGKGPGNSNVCYVLPLPYSDYIFAIIVEEFGLLTAFVLLFAYVAMVYKAGLIAQQCRRTFPAFLVIGLTTIIVLQAFMNVAVAVRLMPMTGQPLPFVSKGGSSLLATGLSLGMILCVTYWLRREEEEEAAKHIQE